MFVFNEGKSNTWSVCSNLSLVNDLGDSLEQLVLLSLFSSNLLSRGKKSKGFELFLIVVFWLDEKRDLGIEAIGVWVDDAFFSIIEIGVFVC